MGYLGNGIDPGGVKPPTIKFLTGPGVSVPIQSAAPGQAVTSPGASAAIPGSYVAARSTNWLLIGGLGTVGIIGALLIFKKKKKGKR